MNPSAIEWTQFTANPVKGRCLHFGNDEVCGTYCYAEEIRHKNGWPAELRFHRSVLEEIKRRRKPSTVFVGSMLDLWADGVNDRWLYEVLSTARACPQHTFLFLTKNPARYARFEFPENCRLGFTDTGDKKVQGPYDLGGHFMSCEPFLGPHANIHLPGAVIMGAGSFRFRKKATAEARKYPGVEVVPGLTKGNRVTEWLLKPRAEWVWALIETAASRRIPIFIKDNLFRAMPELPKALRVLAWRV